MCIINRISFKCCWILQICPVFRVSELIKQMERQHQKEVDETNVLERAVMQVEENLVTTTVVDFCFS